MPIFKINHSLKTIISFISKLFLKLFLLYCLAISLPSFAAVENIVMTVAAGKDGVAPFDADNSPGNDDSASNGIVRTYDRFDYLVSYTALDLSQVSFIFTAPVGVYWVAAGANTSVCNGTGGPQISGGGRILTCPRIPAATQVESFELPAMAGNIAHGTVFTIAVTAGTATAVSQALTISAIAKNEVWLGGSSYTKTTVSGNFGASYGIAIRPGVTNHSTGASVGTIKGLESPKTPLTITLSTLPPGTIVTSCPGTCTQPDGPGTPITISLTNNTNNSLLASASCSGGSSCTGGGLYGTNGVNANFREYSYNLLTLFTPFGTNFPSGVKTPLNIKFTNFAPLSLSNAVNYEGSTSLGFASGYAPGYAPDFNSCPNLRSCISLLIDRTILTELYLHFHGTYHTPTGNLIYGDNEASTNNNGAGAESVLPGHLFTIMYPVTNSTSAEQAANNVSSCVVWNPNKMNLVGPALLKLGSGGEFFRVGSTSWPTISSANRDLEYSVATYADDTARKNADCGEPGDGNANWYSDPNSVPGGINAISSIRYRYIQPLTPGQTLGLMAPFQRPLTPYSLGLGLMSTAPWFMQYWADEKARTASPYSGSGLSGYGGRVNTVDALFRHKVSAGNSVAPGNTITMTLTPIVIGTPITGIDATVKNAKIRVTMPDTCLEPVVASLPAYAIMTTEPNYGADGIPCTGDAGEKAAVVTFLLGDIPAPGGSLTSGYQGHAIEQPSFSFNIVAAVNSPVKSVSWSTFDSADNDPTPVTHTATGAVSIAGVAGFSVVKSSSGTTSGKVGPNETFNYIINFGNGGSVASGRGYFVDLLPFDGDSRGTTGLGSGKLVVTGLSAGMTSPTQGTVQMEVTTDAASSVQSALQMSGNEDGALGIAWSSYSAGSPFPENITAVRFITSNNLNPGYSGFGSIQVKGPTIKSTSSAFNNVWGRTDPIGGDTSTVKVMAGISTVKIQGIDGATIKGKVFVDLNENAVQDASEVGLASSIVSITCIAGACLTAPQGSSFSMLTDANGFYSFQPNLANKVFANSTATGTALAFFDGTVAGTWTITQTPPNDQPYISVSRMVGTVNTIPSGVASGRTISGVAMVGNGQAINYNFGERLEHGKITVTKMPFTLPIGVTGPFNFTFEATCDKPVAGTKYSATLTNFPSNTTVNILNIPANASCTLAEVLPILPTGLAWGTPVFSALSPTGAMPAGGTQTINAVNQIFEGFYVTKTVFQEPVQVAGELTQYDLIYQIDVVNRTTESQTYSLSDTLGLDPDVSVLGAVVVSKLGSNITQSLNGSFTGLGTQKPIITDEVIAAAVGTTPETESYQIKLRININTFNTSNNTCNGSTGNGLLNQAHLSFASNSVQSQACTNTPNGAPVFLKLRVKWVGGKNGDKLTVPATTGFTSANTSAFESINTGGATTYGESEEITVGPSQVGVLAKPVFESEANAKEYQLSAYSCNDGVNTPTQVVANSSLTIPAASAGKSLVCEISSTFIDTHTAKTALPVTGTSISVGDEIIYTLQTVITGGTTLKPVVITDTLDPGLTVTEKPSACSLTGSVLTCTLATGATVGEHSFSYKTKVNSNAVKNSVPGVKNSIVVDSGSCDPCSTEHGMWSVDTSKTSDVAGKKGVEVGDAITYTLTVKIKGGSSTQDIILKDTRSVGLEVQKVPSGCKKAGLIITCVVPSGSAAGQYQFVYTAVVTDDAGDFVSNKVVPNHGTCSTSCKTSIKVLREVMLRITKTTPSKIVKIADFVRYELLVENLTGPDAKKFFIVDQAAPGLQYEVGSLKIVGDDQWVLKSTYPLIIDQLELEKGQKLVITYLMRVTAGAGRGSLKNTAWADDLRKYVSSNKATANVNRGLDPDFEASRIFGKVFEDTNENGIQDENEAGLAGVRLITTGGVIMETDSFGRYHLDDLDPGWNARGSQFLIRLDEASLPANAWLSTPNPLIKRMTPALPVQFNFGVVLPEQ